METETVCRHYDKNGAEHVFFETDGDRCRISFDEKEMTYRRRGELTYELCLESGKRTTATLITAYGRTELACTTYSYELLKTKDAININIKYNMADEDREMEIRIKERK
ncbi:MAG: DUF1934 domain-containing protein [Lachnospiraceae bacterium]|nr:DUF1934 domain-containing protein [Lachnospiraceae bacterium]